MKRFGRFTISKKLILECPWVVQRIMSQCIIILAYIKIGEESIEYQALSYRFDLVDENEGAPEYQWNYSHETDIEAVML